LPPLSSLKTIRFNALSATLSVYSGVLNIPTYFTCSQQFKPNFALRVNFALFQIHGEFGTTLDFSRNSKFEDWFLGSQNFNF
jgi:hypothetical protein